MKKQTLLKACLILLPILAVGLATTTDSVTVFDTITGETAYYSYFDILPVENMQMLPPLAAILSLVSGILAAVWLGKKKLWSLKGAGYTAFAAAVLAAIPIAIRGETLVVPNVGLPLFMLIQYLVCYMTAKQPEEETPAKKAPRLKRK